jgi:hypothetical protein
MRDDAEEIKKRLNERLEQVVKRFWPGAVYRGKRAYCVPGQKKGDLGSFVVHLQQDGKNPRGKWYRNSAGIGGDVLNLYAYGFTGQNHATAEVFQSAREYVGLDDARPETPEQWKRRQEAEAAAAEQRALAEQAERERQQVRTRTAGQIWLDSAPIAGTLAEAYLINRGISVPPGGWSEVLRFHGGLTYDLDERLIFPCFVCRVDDVTGDLTAIWRIYLDPKKPAKAPVANAKLGYGPAAGGAIRIGGIAAHIGVCEGVETGLGISALIKYRYPVWPCMSTAVSGFEPPIEVERITGYPDGDKPWKSQGDDIVLTEPAGRAAMRRLGERMVSIGVKFDAAPEPKIRTDYLDIWQARRRAEASAWSGSSKGPAG